MSYSSKSGGGFQFNGESAANLHLVLQGIKTEEGNKCKVQSLHMAFQLFAICEQNCSSQLLKKENDKRSYIRDMKRDIWI